MDKGIAPFLSMVKLKVTVQPKTLKSHISKQKGCTKSLNKSTSKNFISVIRKRPRFEGHHPFLLCFSHLLRFDNKNHCL